jgi:hypothetical protein
VEAEKEERKWKAYMQVWADGRNTYMLNQMKMSGPSRGHASEHAACRARETRRTL